MPFDGTNFQTNDLVKSLKNGKVFGVVFYRGPSMIDGKPIIAIANGFAGSKNSKTGNIIQTFIMRDDIDPISASRNGSDVSVCGNCKHRGQYENGERIAKTRSCYVTLMHGPLITWKSAQRGIYPVVETNMLADIFAGTNIRFGSYGDPAAVPFFIWEKMMMFANGNTGYTHQWQNEKFSEFKKFCMASADTIEEREKANAMGWRVFRVAPMEGWYKAAKEVLCPASAEAGAKTNCAACKACSGLSGKAKADIVIPAHGNAVIRAAVRKNVK